MDAAGEVATAVLPSAMRSVKAIASALRLRTTQTMLPSLKPMIYFGVTLSVVGGLQLFEEPFILTGGRGGTDQAAMTTAMYMYRTAFEFNDFGGASALSWLLFVLVALLTWLTNRAFKPRGPSA